MLPKMQLKSRKKKKKQRRKPRPLIELETSFLISYMFIPPASFLIYPMTLRAFFQSVPFISPRSPVERIPITNIHSFPCHKCPTQQIPSLKILTNWASDCASDKNMVLRWNLWPPTGLVAWWFFLALWATVLLRCYILCFRLVVRVMELPEAA